MVVKGVKSSMSTILLISKLQPNDCPETPIEYLPAVGPQEASMLDKPFGKTRLFPTPVTNQSKLE